MSPVFSSVTNLHFHSHTHTYIRAWHIVAFHIRGIVVFTFFLLSLSFTKQSCCNVQNAAVEKSLL